MRKQGMSLKGVRGSKREDLSGFGYQISDVGAVYVDVRQIRMAKEYYEDRKN